MEGALEQLAADPGASMHLSDTVHMLETMHDTHANHLIPRVAACDRSLEALASQCLDCKVGPLV